jgi:hypothetical protein
MTKGYPYLKNIVNSTTEKKSNDFLQGFFSYHFCQDHTNISLQTQNFEISYKHDKFKIVQ